MPREMRHTAGGGCRRQVWRRKTSRGAEDTSGGRRHIGRRKMHWKAEEALEAEAEFEMERRGGREFPLQSNGIAGKVAIADFSMAQVRVGTAEA